MVREQKLVHIMNQTRMFQLSQPGQLAMPKHSLYMPVLSVCLTVCLYNKVLLCLRIIRWNIANTTYLEIHNNYPYLSLSQHCKVRNKPLFGRRSFLKDLPNQPQIMSATKTPRKFQKVLLFNNKLRIKCQLERQTQFKISGKLLMLAG